MVVCYCVCAYLFYSADTQHLHRFHTHCMHHDPPTHISFFHPPSTPIAPKASSTPLRRTRSHAPSVTRRLHHSLFQSFVSPTCTTKCASQDLDSADMIAKLRREINGLRSKLAKLNARDKEASGIARVAMVIDRVPRRCLWTLVSHQAQTA